MKSWKLAALVGMTVALMGCISAECLGALPPADWKSHQEQLSKLHYFAADGTLSLAERDKKPVSFSYQWIQNNTSFYSIRTSSPTHFLFSVTILGRLNSVTLWKKPREHVTGPTPEPLLRRELGWILPVRKLYYWMRGVATPGHKSLTYDRYGRLVTLEQDGWYIQFFSYINVKGYYLPQEITLQRQNAAITMVMKHWILTRKDLPVK